MVEISRFPSLLKKNYGATSSVLAPCSHTAPAYHKGQCRRHLRVYCLYSSNASLVKSGRH